MRLVQKHFILLCSFQLNTLFNWVFSNQIFQKKYFYFYFISIREGWQHPQCLHWKKPLVIMTNSICILHLERGCHNSKCVVPEKINFEFETFIFLRVFFPLGCLKIIFRESLNTILKLLFCRRFTYEKYLIKILATGKC